MDFWLGLIVGIIIGWVIEWIIDWRFWRRDANQVASTETRLHRQLADAHREIAALRSQLDEDSEPAGIAADPLDAIAGIDSTIAAGLNAAGIHSYAELAAATPEEIQAIADAEGWHDVNADLWITDAHRLALASPKVDANAS